MPAATLQRVFKTLTDPTRMRILFLLEREELAVQELCQILDTAQSTVSRHLGILREASLVTDRREGTSIYYRYHAPNTTEWSDIWQVARRALDADSATARDLASLDLVLRQREVGSRTWFEEVGPEWDNIRRVFNDDVHRARAMARLIPRKLRVADIGTGTGILARELMAAGIDVIAIDRSERMLESARKSVQGGTDGSVEFRLGEANDLPVADAELDAAMAHMVLHYVASPGGVVQEMARIVQPGGKVIVVDFVQHEHVWMKQELGVLWQGFAIDAIERWFEEAGLHEFELEIDEQPSKTGVELPKTFIASATRPTRAD